MEFGTDNEWFASEVDADQKSEKWSRPVVRRLRKYLNSSREDWQPCRFDFNESDQLLIQGASLPLPSDSADVADAKVALSYVDQYKKAVRSLDARQFEYLCGGILTLLGCGFPRITPRSGDQGIDFFGEFKMTGRLDAKYLLGGPDRLMKSWVVGQAKHYDKEVGPNEIRELAGSHYLASMGVSYDGGRALAEYRAAALQARHVFFVTTGRLTAGTRELVARAGIIVLDEARIAAVLALHSIARESADVDQVAFKSWLTDVKTALDAPQPTEDETEDEGEGDDDDEEEDGPGTDA